MQRRCRRLIGETCHVAFCSSRSGSDISEVRIPGERGGSTAPPGDCEPERLLYHLVILRKRARPRVGLTDPDRPAWDDTTLPVVVMCSYCHSVRYPPDSAESGWVTPERYYELGGSGQARIGHGICSDC